jgi:Protein of unknown function (DUF4245)
MVPVSVDQTSADPAEPALDPSARRRAALRRSAADITRSLAVIVAIIFGVLLLIPRTNQVVQPAVDVTAAARGAADRAGFALSVPQGLPDGWRSTSARLQRNTDAVLTWHVGYLTPRGRYAAFEQAGSPTPLWESKQVTDGKERGTVEVAGQSWVVRSRTDRGVTSWVLRAPGRTTIVTGTADPAELTALASSLGLGSTGSG